MTETGLDYGGPDKLVNAPTVRTARKVQAASGGAAAGSAVGLFLAHWSYQYLPDTITAVDGSAAAWAVVVTSGAAYLSSLGLGRYFRERLENMLLPR